MNLSRRIFLRGAGVFSAVMGAALLIPSRVLAELKWPTAAFEADTMDGAMDALYQTSQASPSDAIEIRAPDIAENGAVVPVTVETELANVESISIITENNPSPLSATFQFGEGAQPFVSTRIKMGSTSNVVAVVKADGEIYSASKEVKVTIGGCGG